MPCNLNWCWDVKYSCVCHMQGKDVFPFWNIRLGKLGVEAECAAYVEGCGRSDGPV